MSLKGNTKAFACFSTKPTSPAKPTILPSRHSSKTSALNTKNARREVVERTLFTIRITHTRARSKTKKMKQNQIFIIQHQHWYNVGVWECVCVCVYWVEKQPTRSQEANNVGPQTNIVGPITIILASAWMIHATDL